MIQIDALITIKRNNIDNVKYCQIIAVTHLPPKCHSHTNLLSGHGKNHILPRVPPPPLFEIFRRAMGLHTTLPPNTPFPAPITIYYKGYRPYVLSIIKY